MPFLFPSQVEVLTERANIEAIAAETAKKLTGRRNSYPALAMLLGRIAGAMSRRGLVPRRYESGQSTRKYVEVIHIGLVKRLTYLCLSKPIS